MIEVEGGRSDTNGKINEKGDVANDRLFPATETSVKNGNDDQGRFKAAPHPVVHTNSCSNDTSCSPAAASSSSLRRADNNNCLKRAVRKMDRAEEVERLIDDPEDGNRVNSVGGVKIPGGSYSKGSSGLFLNAASIITGTSKQETEEVYNEKFNTRSLRKDHSFIRKVCTEKEETPEESSACPGFWYRCPKEGRCESVSWKMCFFCFCLPVCYPCYLSRTIRRRARRRQELEKRDFQPGNLISRAQETLSSQGSRTSSPRKGRLKDDWIDVDIIFTKSSLSEKVIKAIQKHPEFKQSRKSESSPAARRSIKVPESNDDIRSPAVNLSAIMEHNSVDNEDSPVILRRIREPLKIPTPAPAVDIPTTPAPALDLHSPRSNLSPSSTGAPVDSDEYLSLESIIASSPSAPTSPTNPDPDEQRFFSLPSSHTPERIKTGLESLSSGSARFTSAAESLTSGSGRYFTPRESLTSGSGRYFSTAGSLVSGQSGRYFSAAESLSSGYGRHRSHAGSLLSTAPSDYMTPAGSLVSCDRLASPQPVIGQPTGQDDRPIANGHEEENSPSNGQDQPDMNGQDWSSSIKPERPDDISQEHELSEKSESLPGQVVESVIMNGVHSEAENAASMPTNDTQLDRIADTEPSVCRAELSDSETSDKTICDIQPIIDLNHQPKIRGEQSHPTTRIPRCTLNSISTIEEDEDVVDAAQSTENQETPLPVPVARKLRSMRGSTWSPIKLGSLQRTVENQSIRLNFYKDTDSSSTESSTEQSGDIPSVHVVVVAYKDASQLNERLAETGGVLSYLREYWCGYYPLLLIRMKEDDHTPNILELDSGTKGPLEELKDKSRDTLDNQAKSSDEGEAANKAVKEDRMSRMQANMRRKPRLLEKSNSNRNYTEDKIQEVGLFSDYHRLFMREDVDVDFLLDSLARYYLHCTLFQCEDRMEVGPNLPLNSPKWQCAGLCRLASKSDKKPSKKSSKSGFLKSVRKTMYIRRLTSQVSQET